MASTAPPYYHANTTEASLTAPTLPPYTEHAGDREIELASLSRSTSASSSAPSYVHDPLPSHAAGPSSSSSSSSSTFTPTKQLQIQTQGKSMLSCPTPQPAEQIPVFTLTAHGHLERPLYLSVRPRARSGSCFLMHGDDDEAQAPLSMTTYRFGPGRPPVVELADPAQGPLPSSSGGEIEKEMAEGEAGSGAQRGTNFKILGRSIFSRAVRFEAPGLGTFGWRYAGSKERADEGAASLLVCEVFLPASATDSLISHDESGGRRGNGKRKEKKEDKKGTPCRIAQLVRNETYRSPGSSRSSAGNGGRLMLELRIFDEKRQERVEWLVVTTALVMLKREVDRRRSQQIAAIGVVAS
ncbi:hypothetical protein F4808DRAFT_236445 [Astrocystis sublimbata]|nr:hypothetical protein F4808DRAFT_236445 [Astrocystis sublimbata]